MFWVYLPLTKVVRNTSPRDPMVVAGLAEAYPMCIFFEATLSEMED